VIHAITIIDVTTTLAETIRIENKTASHCAMQFENHWLSRYPRPLRCIHDQGTEFIGLNFQHMLAMNGIESVPTTVRNPQANAVCERMHKTVLDMLSSSLREPPDNVATATELVDTCLAAASRALRSAIHQSMQVSPGALVFHRDMLLPIPMLANYNEIRLRRQAIVDENNRKANLRRYFKDYSPGDQVLILLQPLSKLGQQTAGPFPITQVHVNGTVSIERSPGVFERLNIRRIKPFVAPAH
jgi:transposase InsO family protein